MADIGNLFGDIFKAVFNIRFKVVIDGSEYDWNLTEISQYCLLNSQDIENIVVNKK